MPDQRVNWFRLLADLKRAGFSHYAVAKDLGIPRETVRDWSSRVQEPRHYAGELLIAFWCERMDRPRESVPMFDPYDPMA